MVILGYALEEHFPLFLRYGLTPTIYDYAQAVELDRVSGKTETYPTIHLKVDTGMGRVRFQARREAVGQIVKIAKLLNLVLEGIFSH